MRQPGDIGASSGLEDKLKGWTKPSSGSDSERDSDSEREKQERTERMIRQAVDNHPAFKDCRAELHSVATCNDAV